jgi:hypothetical protein
VHLFRPSFSFVAEVQPRLQNRRRQMAVFGRAVNILGDRTNYKAKNIIGKNTYKFVLYIFYSIYYQVTNNLHICIIYGDTTMTGFVANLLDRPTDEATISVRKRVTFRPLLSIYVKLQFSLSVSKKCIYRTQMT